METNYMKQGNVGTIHVVDPSPLNWLYVLFNVVEEPVRTDRRGKMIPSLAESFNWIDDSTLEVKFKKGIYYHDGTPFTSDNAKQHFHEYKRWISPHPPGTWLLIPKGTTMEQIDTYTIRYQLPYPHGIAIAKLRGHHYANDLFWEQIGFGYARQGSGEGHW